MSELDEKFKMTMSCCNCGQEIRTKKSDIEVCKFCGSSVRHFRIDIYDSVTIKQQARIKNSQKGRKKPKLESKIGDSHFAEDGTWSHIEQVVDRENGTYRKLIIDEKGKEIRNENKSLGDHVGHGSAKSKKPS